MLNAAYPFALYLITPTISQTLTLISLNFTNCSKSCLKRNLYRTKTCIFRKTFTALGI